jgi:uncharacterized protein
MRWFVGFVLVAWVSAASCDRRPEGPLLGRPESPETAATSKTDVTVKSETAAPTASLAEPSRCMVPLSVTPPPKPLPAESCPPDPVFGGVTLTTDKLTFADADGAPTIDVELALAPKERQRGLMFRRQMAKDAGMLFHFPGPERVQSFWMRNTCIPLDMLFIADDGFITGIQENVPTLNDASRSIPCPVRYVLEVNAGWTRKHGVRPGQKVKLPKLDR